MLGEQLGEVEGLGEPGCECGLGLRRQPLENVGPTLEKGVEGGIGQRLLHLGQKQSAEPLLFVLREGLRPFNRFSEERAHAAIVARSSAIDRQGKGAGARWAPSLPAAKDLVVLGVRANPPPDDCITGTHAKGPIPASDSG